MQSRPSRSSTTTPVRIKDVYNYLKRNLESLSPKSDASEDAKKLYKNIFELIESLQK